MVTYLLLILSPKVLPYRLCVNRTVQKVCNEKSGVLHKVMLHVGVWQFLLTLEHSLYP